MTTLLSPIFRAKYFIQKLITFDMPGAGAGAAGNETFARSLSLGLNRSCRDVVPGSGVRDEIAPVLGSVPKASKKSLTPHPWRLH